MALIPNDQGSLRRSGCQRFTSWVVCCLALLFSAQRTLADEAYTLYTEELPPFSMAGSQRPEGVAVEIVTSLFTRAGIPFEVEIVPWKRAYVTAQNRNRSCIFPIQRTQEREAKFHWVSPIAITQTAFYTLPDSPHEIRTLADAKPLKIGTYRGSAVADYLGQLGFNIDLTVSETTNLERLRYRRFDVWAADTLAASWRMRSAGGYPLKRQMIFFTSLRSLACNLSMAEADVERLNGLLIDMHRDGTIEALMERYRSASE